MKVVFFPVQSTSAKLAKITETAKTHFDRNEPLLFLVPDQAAWDFLDKLLWTSPAESFLPHPSKLIQIKYQIDTTPHVFNLTPAALSQEGLKTVYELEDHTSSEKLLLSQKRYQEYRDRSLQIILS